MNTEPITEIPVGQTRNHNLVVQFLRGGYFDSEIDAWRAARRLGPEIDLMTAEETTSDAVDPKEPPANVTLSVAPLLTPAGAR